jgi:hypothetical protein
VLVHNGVEGDRPRVGAGANASIFFRRE